MVGFVDSAEKKNRVVVKVSLLEGAKDIVAKLARQEDMTEQAIAGRIYQWFTEQPGVMQRWVLGQIPDEMRPEALKRIVEYYQSQFPDEDIDIIGKPGDSSDGGGSGVVTPRPRPSAPPQAKPGQSRNRRVG